MKMAFLLLHDFRFADQSFEDFLGNFHFSKEYARLVAERGHEVSLYTFANGIDRPAILERDGYTIKAFPVQAYFPPGMSFGNSHSASLLKELSSEKPDLVHFHTYQLWNYPYVALFSKLRGFKLVSQYHGRVDPLTKVKEILFSLPYRLADRYLVPFDGEANELARYAGVSRERIVRFPNRGVDVRLFRRVCPREERPLLLYVGRTPRPSSNVFEKSPDLLLHIMRELKSMGEGAKLLIAGEGPGLGRLIGKARALGIDDSVTFLGRVSQEELPELYSRAWLSFDPMHMDDIEPFWGGTLKESLACGTPVVAFNDENPRASEWGYLIPTEARAAATAVRRALLEREQSDLVEREGPPYIAEHCSWDTVITSLLAIYGGLTN